MEWIDKALHFFGLGWLNGMIAVGSVAFAVLAYVWARKRTKISHVYLGEHLLGSASDSLPPAIVVQYNGHSIPRLTKSLLVIWNSGENTITGDAIVEKDPLRVQVGEDGKILSVSVLKSSRAVNDFRIVPYVNKQANEAILSFDFLDSNDGAVIEILHTSTDRKPRLKGTLRGLPKGFSNYGQFTRPKPQKKSKTGKLVDVIFSPLVLGAAGFLFAMYGPRPIFLTPDGANSFIPGLLGGFFGMWAVHAYSSRRKYPRVLHLEALE
ncbi:MULTISPECIES: hypothetical protein [unclassified Pseudomonas]